MARIPDTIPAPSNAGPDAHEAEASQSLLAKTSSPFVPKSMSNERCADRCIPDEIISPTASPPTTRLTLGRQYMLVLGFADTPRSPALTMTGSRETGVF